MNGGHTVTGKVGGWPPGHQIVPLDVAPALLSIGCPCPNLGLALYLSTLAVGLFVFPLPSAQCPGCRLPNRGAAQRGR